MKFVGSRGVDMGVEVKVDLDGDGGDGWSRMILGQVDGGEMENG